MNDEHKFVRGALKVSVAQLIQEAGFAQAQSGALETLTDLVENYIVNIGLHTHDATVNAGRTESNFLDTLAGLDGVGSDLEDLKLFRDLSDELPFAKMMPVFPSRKKATLISGPQDDCKTDEAIPSFLPRYPAERTYKETPVFSPREADSASIRRRKIKETRQIEASLTTLTKQSKTVHKLTSSVPAVQATSSTPMDTSA
jgi:hypothetical protein